MYIPNGMTAENLASMKNHGYLTVSFCTQAGEP